MRSGAAFRGQPLLLLSGLLGGWLALRAATWQPLLELPAGAPRLLAGAAPLLAHVPAPARVAAAAPFAVGMAVARPAAQVRPAALRRSPARGLPLLAAASHAPTYAMPAPARYAVGHNLLLAAGLARMELPPALVAHLQTPAPVAGVPAASPPPIVAQDSGPARWSADGWLLLRHEAAAPAPTAAGLPSYGRSQAGAVLRYALAPASAHRPQAYVRASAALAGPRDEDVAAGLTARPLPAVPLRVAAEARVGRTAGGTELRPAAYAVTELPPARLPLGARGEAYLQAGYVGGAFATAFVDGQARIDRRVARLGEAEVRAGAGAWGGAQRGAARLDVGPSAALTFRLGETRGRVAADYRFRVAGEAQPASGPALTISAGF